MTTSVFMKVLESTPHRYDRGIQMLFRGRISKVYLDMAEMVAAPGRLILDIGCGTGNASLACAFRGATVIAIDPNAEMLEVAVAKAEAAGLADRVEWLQLGVAEIGRRVGRGSLDAAVSCLTFSELTPDERRYALATVLTLLKPGGAMVIADEVLPRGRVRRSFHRLARLPLAFVTYLITQTTTQPLGDPEALLTEAGFTRVESNSLWSGSFAIVRGYRGEGD